MEKQMTKEEIASARSIARTLRISRRSILYFIRTILLALLIVLLCVLAFLTAARFSNAYILVNEGMTLRASSMLMGGDNPDLAVYFTGDCIRNDAVLRTQTVEPFASFSITDYEYDLNVERMHVYPWQSDAYVDVIEQVTSIKAVSSSETPTDPAPAWTPIRYRLRLARIDGRWYIGTIELVELNPALPAANTPDPNRSPIPMATPTPEPTPILMTIS